MSIHIEDLTVRFKNGVTAINHANLNIRMEFLDYWEKMEQERQL